MNELALFAGAGGGILGGTLHGRRTVCAVERDAYAAQILAQRQNDGILKVFPIWSDITTFDGKPWRGIVDVVSGGFPCQDISAAGGGAGIDGDRSGLWSHMSRIICEVEPEWVEVENSPMLTSRGLGRVLGDLAEMGFDAEWGVISAADTDAPHLRERIWIVAHSNRVRELQPKRSERNEWRRTGNGGEEMANAMRQRQQRIISGITDAQVWKEQSERPDRSRGYGFGRWPTEPGMGRVADGVANRMDRIKALGNGQVPRVEATAFALLSGR